MDVKLFCPHCGRCLGYCTTTDKLGQCKILISKPEKLKEEHFVHNMKCFKCKNEIYILMGFEK